MRGLIRVESAVSLIPISAKLINDILNPEKYHQRLTELASLVVCSNLVHCIELEFQLDYASLCNHNNVHHYLPRSPKPAEVENRWSSTSPIKLFSIWHEGWGVMPLKDPLLSFQE